MPVDPRFLYELTRIIDSPLNVPAEPGPLKDYLYRFWAWSTEDARKTHNALNTIASSPAAGAIANNSFVTINNEGGLTNERRLAAVAPITRVDNGPNSTVDIGVTISALTPQPLGTAAPGASGQISDAAHIHPFTDRLQNTPGSSLTLTSDGTNQNLVGSLGDLRVTPTSGLVFESNEAQANQIAAFTLRDLVGNGAGVDRTLGFYTRVVNREGIGAFDPDEFVFALTAETLPKLILNRPGANSCVWMDSNNMRFGTGLDANGIPTGFGNFLFNAVAGTQVEWRSLVPTLNFNNDFNGAAIMNFRLRSNTGVNPTIAFQTDLTENAASTVPQFSFTKAAAYGGSGPFMRWILAGTTQMEFGQTGQFGLKDTAGTALRDIIFTDTVAAATRRSLTIDMRNANQAFVPLWLGQDLRTTVTPTFVSVAATDTTGMIINSGGADQLLLISLPGGGGGGLRFTCGGNFYALTMQGNALLDDWFDQNVKTTAAVSHSRLITTDTANGVQINGGGGGAMKLLNSASDTALRTVTIRHNDVSRTITLSGDPTLGNWFNQGVASTDSPTFVDLTLTGVLSVQGNTTIGNATTDTVRFNAGGNAAAPGTNAIGVVVDYYGTSATRVLTTPNRWWSIIADDGNTYKIPLYS